MCTLRHDCGDGTRRTESTRGFEARNFEGSSSPRSERKGQGKVSFDRNRVDLRYNTIIHLTRRRDRPCDGDDSNSSAQITSDLLSIM